jgi:EAL domain-containing protein (putative c-di-GMP-specific phosphodiesterase class I)
MALVSKNIFTLEQDIRYALDNKEFALYYQPQIDTITGKIFGVEALLRWDHPTKGRINPLEFIPLAEETGQIIPLGEWVLREACRVARRWVSDGVALTMSVNVSIIQLKHPQFLDIVKKAISDHSLPRLVLDLELTEGIMIGNVEKAITLMNELRSLGVLISIDDFGTGFSSLSYLRQMPITQLKIDNCGGCRDR